MNLLVGYFLVLSFIPQMSEGIFNEGGEAVIVQDPVNLDNESLVFSANMGLSFKYGRLSIEPSIKTYMLHYDKKVFLNPFQSDYELRAELDIIKRTKGRSSLTLGAYHICIHPVIYKLNLDPGVMTNRTELYLKLQGIF